MRLGCSNCTADSSLFIVQYIDIDKGLFTYKGVRAICANDQLGFELGAVCQMNNPDIYTTFHPANFDLCAVILHLFKHLLLYGQIQDTRFYHRA